ncbi:MAG TPA: O-antigen ligase family protein [Acidimicrobiales bacterium]|nr:O-antigen ligase family protein [Acidimicrobiales bacterium]
MGHDVGLGRRSLPRTPLALANLVLLGLLMRDLAGPVLLLAVVAPVAVSVMRRPQRGLLLLAALVPFDGLLLIAPVPRLTAGWKEALVLLTVAATWIAPPGARGGAGRRLPPWWPAVAGLLGLGIVSGVVVGGLQAVIGLKVVFFYVLVAVAAWRCPLDAAERDRLVSVLMVNGVVTAAVGIGQQVVGAGRLNALGYEYNVTLRTTGGLLRSFSTFNQPFAFGFFLMLVVLIGVPVALTDTGRWRNRAFLASLPLLGVALGLTFVRGAWIGVALGLAYLGFTRYSVLLLALPVGMVALLFLPSDLSGPALSSSSSVERVTSWEERGSQVLAHPVGAGVGSSGAASEKLAELQGGGQQYQPDNFYLKIVLELGVVGLWLFVLLMASMFLTARSAAARLQGADAALASGVAATLVAAAVASMVATYLEIFPTDFFFWLVSGVVATCVPEWR